MSFTTIFFDLDDTLYPPTAGLWAEIRQRMNDYMHQRLGLPLDQVATLRRQFYETYGTTLRGLQHFHMVDSDDFLAYVHDLPLTQFIFPEPQVRDLLLQLPLERWIFTNADDNHARRVLSVLNLSDCFRGIIDVRAMDFLNKPDPLAYQRALEIAGCPKAENCIYLDDSARNLAPARNLGFTTILVSPDPQDNAADFQISHLNKLPPILEKIL